MAALARKVLQKLPPYRRFCYKTLFNYSPTAVTKMPSWKLRTYELNQKAGATIQRCFYPITLHVRHFGSSDSQRTLGAATTSSTDKDYASAAPLHTLNPNNEKRHLEITFRDGTTQTYPYPWLRDNCRCESCYSHSTFSRQGSIHDLDIDAIPSDVSLSTDKTSLIISWPDGHTSTYINKWLKENRFSFSEDDIVFAPKHRYWGSDVEKYLCTLTLADVCEDDNVLLKMLMELKTLGMCRITGVGKMSGQVEKLANRIAFLHFTYFG